MGSFGNILKKYREQHNITKLALAKGIGTSDAYIRQIENQGYKPPTFGVCKKIAEFLSLNNEEIKDLYEKAFIERIESEKDFYETLKSTLFVKQKPDEKNELIQTNYQITWHLRKLLFNKLIPISTHISTLLDASFSINKISCSNINISDKYIQFEISTKNIAGIQKTMPSIMKLTSSKIKNQHPGFSGAPSIWKNNFDISKVTDSTTTEKSANHLELTKNR